MQHLTAPVAGEPTPNPNIISFSQTFSHTTLKADALNTVIYNSTSTPVLHGSTDLDGATLTLTKSHTGVPDQQQAFTLHLVANHQIVESLSTPEPASFAIFGMGLGGLLVYRRFRRA